MALDSGQAFFLRRMSEAQAIRERYARRVQSAGAAEILMLVERKQALANWLRRTGIDAGSAWILDVGCGYGDGLAQFLELGFPARNLSGVDLMEKRVAVAQRRLPSGVRLLCADATELSFEPVDVVSVFTVFSSVLDHNYRQFLAQRIWQMVKPGGGVLWYDFQFDNPMNRDVSGVTAAQITRLFPDALIHQERLTLAPPLARVVAKIHPALYRSLTKVSFLRTHLLCWLERRA